MPRKSAPPPEVRDPSQVYIRIKGVRGVHRLLKVYTANSGRQLVDYIDTKTHLTRSVTADVARRLCGRCQGRVDQGKRPVSSCETCDVLQAS